MLQQISKIEVHSLAAIPALRTEAYDGWHLRFSKNHTRRANSVNIVTPSKLPLSEKINFCEIAYSDAKQTCHFRLTPLADEGLDDMLALRGYGFFGQTEVRVQNLEGLHFPTPREDVIVLDPLDHAWLKGVTALTGQDEMKQVVFREMLSLIDLRIHALAIKRGGEIVACGMGVQSSNLLGLFEFATHPNFKRRGFAADIARHMLRKAQTKGIEKAYLQVADENNAGKGFWSRMGFRDTLYRYHYRTKL